MKLSLDETSLKMSRQFSFRHAASIAAVAALSLSGCGGDSSANGEGKTIRVATIGYNMTQIGDMVGVEEGFFEKHGVNVEYVNFASVPAANAALIAGNVDLVTNDGVNMNITNANIKDKSQKLVWTTSMTPRMLTEVMAGPSLKVDKSLPAKERLQVLRGKKIGVPALGGAMEMVLREMLTWAGISGEDVTLVGVGTTSGAVAALKSGSIDALVTIPPSGLLATKNGASYIYNAGMEDEITSTSPWMWGGYAHPRKLADSKAEALRGFQAGMAESIKFIQDPKNVDQVVEDWGKYNETLEPQEMKGVIESYRDTFGVKIDCKGLANVGKVLVKNKAIKKEDVLTCDDVVWEGSSQLADR